MADRLRLADVIASLSLATDLAMGQPLEHALASCLLAVRLAESLGFSAADRRATYYQALLRYIGCNADTAGLSALVGDEIAMRTAYASLDTADTAGVMRVVSRSIWQAHTGESPLQILTALAQGMSRLPGFVNVFFAGHCEVAERLAERLGFDATIQIGLTQLYERWDGKGLPRGLKGEAVAPAVRVVTLAQDIVTIHRIGGIDAAVSMAKQRSGHAYDPAMVERFCRDAPALCADLVGDVDWDAVFSLEPGGQAALTEDAIDAACQAIADFADIKSFYSLNHSSRVAALAAEAARSAGLPADDVTRLRRAALVHDVGRVGVSAGIWSKAGTLTTREWEKVRLHPYYTERVLARPPALAALGSIASQASERIDGSGYHRGTMAQAPAVRLLAAADVYAALTAARPHRPALDAADAADSLQREARAGRLDADAVQAVLAAAGHRTAARRSYAAGLSEREVEVLRLLAHGNTTKQIADALFISAKTADNHIQHIYTKIDVSTRAGATLYALEHDLV